MVSTGLNQQIVSPDCKYRKQEGGSNVAFLLQFCNMAKERKSPKFIYHQRYDGEGFLVQSGVRTRWACCDCGLVHDLVFCAEDGKDIGVAVKVNKSATAAKRRERKKKEDN